MHRRSISGAIAERLQATDEVSLARGSQAQPSSSEKPPASPFARAAVGEGHPMPGHPRQPGGAGTASAAVTQEDVHKRVVNDFQRALKESKDMAVAVAAIKALTGVIQDSTAKTLMGVGKELERAASALQRFQPTSISLKAACELFQRYTARQSDLGMEDFETSRAKLIQSGEQFAQISYRARQRIADIGARHIREGSTIMVHGYSRCVVAILQRAVAMGSKFSAVVTEGRPDESGLKMAKELANISMPVSVVLDSAAACMLERVDMVLVGAEGVVESGGIINKLGTYQIALCARSCNIPFYVAAESYKFARYFPLNQADVPTDLQPVDFGPLLPAGVTVQNPSRDYTPPAYITLLVTDLGMLTPAAVSDELIQLYA